MPVRKIPKNYRNVTGIQSIDKAVGHAQFESTLERDFLVLMHFSREVQSVEVQPLKIPMDPSSGSKSYTPDALVKFASELDRKPWLCEVKYRKDIKKYWPKLKPKFLQAIRYCKSQGWRFRIITEVEIRTSFLQNARFLTGYLNRLPDPVDEELLLRALGDNELAIEDLLRKLSSDEFGQLELIPVVWHLVAVGKVATDLDAPLTMASVVWLDHD